MSKPIPICQDKRRLLADYQNATEAYASAVAELARMIGVVAQADYGVLTVATQRARRLSASAHEALEAHLDEHGC